MQGQNCARRRKGRALAPAASAGVILKETFYGSYLDRVGSTRVVRAPMYLKYIYEWLRFDAKRIL